VKRERERDLSPLKLEYARAWLDQPHPKYEGTKQVFFEVSRSIQIKIKTVFPVQLTR